MVTGSFSNNESTRHLVKTVGVTYSTFTPSCWSSQRGLSFSYSSSVSMGDARQSAPAAGKNVILSWASDASGLELQRIDVERPARPRHGGGGKRFAPSAQKFAQALACGRLHKQLRALVTGAARHRRGHGVV